MEVVFLEGLSERVISVYKYLHTIPEPGFEEHKTAAFLAEQLSKAGYDVQTGIGGTGVVGTLNSGMPGPVVGLRADMDALVHMINGTATAIHSCGHDAHSAMVLVVAEQLAAKGISKGKFKVIFQPAEEKLTGAARVFESGVMNDIDILFGVHLRPKDNARLGEATPALCNAASTIVEATIKGVAAHGSRPHLGVNAIEAAVSAVNHVNTIRMNPMVPWSAKVTRLLAGGGAANVICDEAKLAFDLRAQENEVMAHLKEKVAKAIELGAASVGASAEITVHPGVPAAVYDAKLVELAKKSIEKVLGSEGVLLPEISPGGEDFHLYTYNKPSIRAAYIGLGCNLEPGVHNPNMHFSLDALPLGVKILMQMVVTSFDEGK
ncbi:MAG: amidohydrolase [Acidaminococcaceae bacterium]